MNTFKELFESSSSPLILVGAGARGWENEIIAFAEKWNVPMETTWNAIDLVPFDHPLFVGRPGIVATRGSNLAIQNCDLLVSIGARLDQPTVAYEYSNFAPKAKKILVDIDRSEAGKIPLLDLYIQKTIEQFVKEFDDVTQHETSSRWLTQCGEWKLDRLEDTTETYQLMESMIDKLPSDAIIVMNCGMMAVNIICAGFRNKAGQRFIMASCGSGSMGAAIPVSIGVALASGKRVLVIDGDGSFMQNVQELEVIKRLSLPITIIVISNGGYASIHSSELRAFERTKQGESIPNIQAIARAFGLHTSDFYENVLFLRKDTFLPSVIELHAPSNELPIPRVMFDGVGSLDNMYPYPK